MNAKTAKKDIINNDFVCTDWIYPARQRFTGAAYMQNNGLAGSGISLYLLYLYVTTTSNIIHNTNANQNANVPIFVFSKAGAETLATASPT